MPQHGCYLSILSRKSRNQKTPGRYARAASSTHLVLRGKPAAGITRVDVNRVDRFIRDRRIAQAARFIRPGSRVLDIGCHDGHLFRMIAPALREGVGMDPDLAGPLCGTNFSLRPGHFPEDAPDEPETFDSVCALAVLEHIDANHRPAFAAAIARMLRAGGEAILTVPAPTVDRILAVMMRLRILDGMEVGQHHGFEIAEVEPLFVQAGLAVERHLTFQFGLNHLFVFRKPSR
jgi:2-polyprenyl-3-methyl-5-hydroxy-6-metoxy-1,4-benzoquinol methylase